MPSFPLDPFLVNALLASILASILGGVIGSYIVVKRMVFLSGSISHSVLGGIGLALLIDRLGIFPFPPLLGSLFAAILSAFLIGYIHLRYKEREDTIISSVWTLGISLGVIFISFTPGYNVELNNFLIGNILWTSTFDLWVLLFSALFVLLSVYLFHKKFLAFSFDEEFTALQGVSIHFLYLFLLVLISVAIVLLIQSVGVILVMSMLTLPPAIANFFTTNLTKMMILGSFLSMVFSVLGIYLSYTFDLPVGATIALLSGLFYLAALSQKMRIRHLE